jgi:hypothetical protein
MQGGFNVFCISMIENKWGYGGRQVVPDIFIESKIFWKMKITFLACIYLNSTTIAMFFTLINVVARWGHFSVL